MRPNHEVRRVTSFGATEQVAFGISHGDEAHLMTILRDTLYSDKVLAVIREYSANAWDAHLEAGIGDKPISVTLPTNSSQTLTIRDFGAGLSQDAVFNVYAKYGRSTKRGNDGTVGMLGIGSKSGFAYSDSFSITSWNGGKKMIYSAILDKTEKGYISLLYTGDCDPAETGIQIQIPVAEKDIPEFHEKAKELFRYFRPRPTININLPVATGEMVLKNGVIYEEDTGEWVALMGCVPYKVDLSQVIEHVTANSTGAAEYLRRISGALFFEIGDIQISASREYLKYSDKTREVLIKKFNDLIEEFANETFKELDNNDIPLWGRRLRARMLNRFDLPIPKPWEDLARDTIEIDGDLTHFYIRVNDRTVKTISVTNASRFLIQDCNRKLDGYDLTNHDYVIFLKSGSTWSDARKELDNVLVKSKITGIPIGKLSNFVWTAPLKKTYNGLSTYNPKHGTWSFRYNRKMAYSHTASAAWEVEKRVQTENDVFVILNRFCPDVEASIKYTYDNTVELLDMFGNSSVVMPKIYGYKSTGKNPVTRSDVLGTHFDEWAEKLPLALVTPGLEIAFLDLEWDKSLGSDFNWDHSKGAFKKVIYTIGKDHPITRLIAFQLVARMRNAKSAKKYGNRLLDLYRTIKKLNAKLDRGPEVKAEINKVYEKYPLILLEGPDVMLRSSSLEWAKYVKIIDNLQGETK